MGRRRHLWAWAACWLGPATASAEPVSVRPSLELIAATQGIWVAESDANAGNQTLRIPRFEGRLEVRPDAKVELGPLALRARIQGFASSVVRVVGDEWLDSQPTFGSQWLTLYGELALSDDVRFAYGLHNFEWGPAESTSPSNGLVRNPTFSSTLLTVYPGRHLARLNVSSGKELSFVLMLETFESAASSKNDPFEPKGQAKIEYAATDGGYYLGAVAGMGQTWKPWFGLYGQAEVLDGFSLYFDGRLTWGSRAFYPLKNAYGFEQTRILDENPYLFVVGGARYAFEEGADVRLEIIHDDAGYTPEQLERSVRFIQLITPFAGPYAGIYAAPGLDLPGRDYLYLSVRVPDLGPQNAISFHFRELMSLADETGVGFLAADYALTDSLVLDATLALTHGKKDGELTRTARALGLVAAQYTW